MSALRKSNGILLSTTPNSCLEDTPPSSPKSASLDQFFENSRISGSRLYYGSLVTQRDPLIDMYNEKRRTNTLTQLEEQLVQEVVELRKKMLKLLPAHEQDSSEPHEDAFELSAFAKNILRSVRVGSRTSGAEYHLVRCMRTLKSTQEELCATKQLVEKQDMMLKSLLTQNSELVAYIDHMHLQQQRKL